MGDKDQVKSQLHDITERMSKLLCNYEGDKECDANGDASELKMKDGLMETLTDFHQIANAREDLLETLMHWFEGSSKVC